MGTRLVFIQLTLPISPPYLRTPIRKSSLIMGCLKECMEVITLLYYIVNVLVTVGIFAITATYLRDKDRSDQKRQQEEDRKDHHRREWRQFAERIYSDYSKLKSKDIPWKISKVKNTFERILIHSNATGLDVLRYMFADNNYRNFSSESPQLRALREDLHMIFLPLNICSSLLLLGKVPENIKEEVRLVVEELGNVAKPFFSGKQRSVASTCLEHFGSTGSSNAAATENDEIRVSEDTVPYINLLQFGGPSDGESQGNSMDECDYSKCAKFSLNLKGKIIMDNSDKNLTFLIKLHTCLEHKALEEHFARILREQLPELPAGSRMWISDNDGDEVILTKVLHEVRLYIHHTPCENLHSIEADRMDWLREVYKKVTEFYPTEEKIRSICFDFISSLQNIRRNPPSYLINKNFLDKFEQLYEYQFPEMIQVATVSDTSG